MHHLGFLMAEAIRSRGEPKVLRGEDPSSVVSDFYATTRGQQKIAEALRTTSTPAEFARLVRVMFENWVTDLWRRQGEPRLYARTAELLEKDDGTNYKRFGKARKKRFSTWGRPAWLEPGAPHPPQNPALEIRAATIALGLERVADDDTKRSASIILRRPELVALVEDLLDHFRHLLQLDHFAWLYPRLFPHDYERGGSFAPDPAATIGVLDTGYDDAAERSSLESFGDRRTYERVATALRHGWNIDAAAAELDEDPRLIAATVRDFDDRLGQQGLDRSDFARALARGVDHD